MNIISTLVGTWFICSTNFPMWLKGDKLDPTFTYSLTDKKADVPVLLDEVKYRKKGKQKTLTGYDYQDKHNPAAFVWRGKGLLSLVRSNWRVAMLDPEGQWAVIWFSKTLFTPEGVDVISRKSSLTAEQLNQIKAQMTNESLLKKHLQTLHDLNR
ncbi:lipocalin family protein [Spirosoma sp. KUDC1026]|uniref:lipocalin family protein n=1 Tax=Spirosoma sp. KUDC1026 TaxID=2745947 RepID=UPI00159BBE8D|nr:lipocalin family protein [Spirosoma sp. KUDC1026]QKZ13124.1 lipocalin family protein [Spirosoma sp. KUDC1026]